MTPLFTTDIEVAVDRETAFRAFTEEFDLWWLRGPINNYDSARLVAMRVEPGVGGRILEDYGDAVLEVARFTAWDPPSRLAFDSLLDDVVTDVRFEDAGGATKLTLTCTLAEGGKDEGGSSVASMAQTWFVRWCERRDELPHVARERALLGIQLPSPDPGRTARFLRDVFGLEPYGPIPEGTGGGWIEFDVGGCFVAVIEGEPVEGAGGITPMVFVTDIHAHHDHAVEGGAIIVSPIVTHGFTGYVAEDPDGRRWNFARASPGQLSARS